MSRLPKMVRVSGNNPCPACKKHDWCLVAHDKKACICKRVESGRALKNDAGWLHKFDDGLPRILAPVDQPKPKKPSGINWNDEAIRYACNLSSDRKHTLTRDLGLPDHGLDPILFIGWREDRGDHCFTFPERDGTGKIIGINRRYWDKSKKLILGGSRGITLPKGWSTPSDNPLFIAEGPTDVAALVAAGIPAIGRPSNNGGVQHLAVALSEISEDRTVCVIGENDLRMNWVMNKPMWPGLEGAVAVARQLAELLPHNFVWALPPDSAKDVREWLTSKYHGNTAWKFRGWDFISSITKGFYGADVGIDEFKDLSRMSREELSFEEESWDIGSSIDEILGRFVSVGRPARVTEFSALFQ